MILSLALMMIASINAYYCVCHADNVTRHTSLKIKTWLILRVLFSAGLLIAASLVHG